MGKYLAAEGEIWFNQIVLAIPALEQLAPKQAKLHLIGCAGVFREILEACALEILYCVGLVAIWPSSLEGLCDRLAQQL
jgi:hypothetical protein